MATDHATLSSAHTDSRAHSSAGTARDRRSTCRIGCTRGRSRDVGDTDGDGIASGSPRLCRLRKAPMPALIAARRLEHALVLHNSIAAVRELSVLLPADAFLEQGQALTEDLRLIR